MSVSLCSDEIFIPAALPGLKHEHEHVHEHGDGDEDKHSMCMRMRISKQATCITTRVQEVASDEDHVKQVLQLLVRHQL